MATTQTANIQINASASAAKNGRNTSAGIDTTTALANGTLASQADKAYYDLITIAASGSPQNLDLNGTSLVDINGDPLALVDVVFLMVKAPAGNTVNVAVGGGSNAFDFGIGTSATITIQPGEAKVLIDTTKDPGYPVTAGTADILKAAIASGTNQQLEVLIVGRSA